MEDFKNNFSARRDEIYAFLKTMKLLEKNELDNPGSFSAYLQQGANSDEEPIPTYIMIANILKSDLALMLYNYIEFSVSGLLDLIYDYVQNDSLCFSKVSTDIQTLWRSKELKATNDPTSNFSTHLKINKRMIDHVLNECIIELSARDTISGGNLDYNHIDRAFKNHGMNIVAGSAIFRENRFSNLLDRIKRDRNSLAHGATSFEESLRDKTIQELLSNMEDITQFLLDLIEITSNYLEAKKYQAVV